jgi:glycosyl-4,4'-diaponeurosporenoate acyltransferase
MNMFPLIPVHPLFMLFLNIILWPIFHLGISKITLHMSINHFNQDKGIFRLKKFEQSGTFYEQFLGIRTWKKWIPDGATIFNEGFKKKHLQGTEKQYIQTFINETRRAEWTHILQIFPCLVFFVFNSFWIAMIMVAYALMFNVPLIWLQRYNRARFLRVLKRL